MVGVWALFKVFVLACPSLASASQLASRSSRHALALQSRTEAQASAHRSAERASLRRLQERSVTDIDTATLVSTLQEVVQGIEQEQENGRTTLSGGESDCKATQEGLQRAITDASRVAARNRDDVGELSAVAKDLDATIESLQAQIKESSAELDKIQRRRIGLSKTYSEDQKRSQVSLQQLERVIDAVRVKLGNGPHEPREGGRAFIGLGEEVAVLEQLQQGLVDVPTDATAAPAFLQMHRTAGSPKKKNLGKLQEDETNVLKKSQAREQEYRKQVNALADLQKDEEEELQKLEQELASQRTAAADKWQQVAEANRTMANAVRSMQRDQDMLEEVQAKCEMTAAFHSGQIDLRSSQTTLLSSAIKLLESMDVGMFLAKDVHALPGNALPSFLQLSADNADSTELIEPKAFVQEQTSLGTESEEETSSGAATGGPFDKVIQMMQGLIDSLRDQANEDTQQFQFCQKSIGQLRRQRLSKRAAFDVQSSEIRWAKVATARLGDQVKFLSSELQRLDDLVVSAKAAADKEIGVVNKEIEDHNLAKQVVSQVVTVLVQLCELPAPAPAWSFAQTESNSTGQASTRGSSCSEATGALQGVLAKLTQQHQAAGAYVKAVSAQAGQAAREATANKNQRSLELTKAKASLANREAEMMKAKEDQKNAKQDLMLLEEQKKKLDQSCGPGSKETHSERMARRKEEIEALKSALSVLNGESLPDPA
mmetsp:Transcript_46332/g.107844  ORF Transcript_46332/g.107844 Transcript_46332/m.107844 type:complete len:714 (-) Transcript_46332:13-2154(-)